MKVNTCHDPLPSITKAELTSWCKINLCWWRYLEGWAGFLDLLTFLGRCCVTECQWMAKLQQQENHMKWQSRSMMLNSQFSSGERWRKKPLLHSTIRSRGEKRDVVCCAFVWVICIIKWWRVQWRWDGGNKICSNLQWLLFLWDKTKAGWDLNCTNLGWA